MVAAVEMATKGRQWRRQQGSGVGVQVRRMQVVMVMMVVVVCAAPETPI